MTVSARELTERPRYLILNGKKKKPDFCSPGTNVWNEKTEAAKQNSKTNPFKKGLGTVQEGVRIQVAGDSFYRRNSYFSRARVTHTMKYCLAIKRNVVPVPATLGMNLKNRS